MAISKDAYTDEQNARMEALYDATDILGGKNADIEQVVKVAEYILTGRWGEDRATTTSVGSNLYTADPITSDGPMVTAANNNLFEVAGKPAVLHYLHGKGGVLHAIHPGQNNTTGLIENVTCDICLTDLGQSDRIPKEQA